MRVLVCGGRAYSDRECAFRILDAAHAVKKITTVIHGAAKGADTLAGEWATSRNVDVERFPANWTAYGNSAGPRRNAQMLSVSRPNLVIAFPGGRGTDDMVARARVAGFEVRIIR